MSHSFCTNVKVYYDFLDASADEAKILVFLNKNYDLIDDGKELKGNLLDQIENSQNVADRVLLRYNLQRLSN